MEEKNIVTTVKLEAVAYDWIDDSSMTINNDIVGVYPGCLDVKTRAKIARVILRKFCNKHEVPVPRKFKKETDDRFYFDCLGPVGYDTCEGIITFLEIETGKIVNI